MATRVKEQNIRNHLTAMLIHVQPGSRFLGTGFISITFTIKGETSCVIFLY